MRGDLVCRRDPDIIVARDVLENTLKISNAKWLADEEGVQPDAEDRARTQTLLVEHIKLLDHRIGKLLTGPPIEAEHRNIVKF